ncbi:MAG TPA: hypothetical protein VHV82_09590 [Sporichthyaceae bacterium]|nr:hypothetical protein [Sporichthyaceae bacterium]
MSALGWYGVRCMFAWGERDGEAATIYEERITIWQAASFEGAIALAEQEGAAYAAGGLRRLGLVQAFVLDAEPGHGAEVFALARRSTLDDGAYLDHFFDTGAELRGAGPTNAPDQPAAS